ncbi:MAG: hypothetical protein KBA91_03310 [Candidatus Moranbacteria bacterium]|jgi:uncharacterized protein involved in exopolysaccharide biosynthesis|nr:hypothetical protein [Candidatus Moranbacteria bacterium]
MELRNFIALFRKQKTLFLGILFVSVVGSWVWQSGQPLTYRATLLLNIGRTGASATTDYTYDSFYRLQADERFADTVVRWLSAPRVVEDIYTEAHLESNTLGIKTLGTVFSAGRLSSQVIAVQYGGANKKALEQMAQSAVTVLNRYTNSLNTEARDKSWFVVLGSEPVVRDGRVSLHLALLVGALLGLFVGFWAVLIRHYFSRV